MMKQVLAYMSLLCIVVAIAACIGQMACGEAQRVERAVIDCTVAERVGIVAKLEPGIKELVETGQFSVIEHELLGLTQDIAGCVLATAVADTLQSSPSARSAVAPPAPPASSSAVMAEFERLRASRFGGAKFVTRAGTL